MKPTINFEDYVKIDVRVGKIISAEVPLGSEALIKFVVDFGEEGQRVIFSGIKKWYSPEELVGKQTMWVINLAPKKTPFGESEGMLFAVDDSEGNPVIVEIPESVGPGSAFH
jgi:methionyl-tRNA synthetase